MTRTVPSPLYGWVNKKAALPRRYSMAPDEDEQPVADASANEWSVSVALDEAVPLYSIAEAKWQSLAQTRRATDTYLKEAEVLIDGLWGGWLDSEERDLIISTLGEPPAFCLPIYVVSVGQGKDERVVYIGKTSSSTRFSNGHSVGLKLHHPEYTQLVKTVYRCSVLLHVHNEYVALEWVEPDVLAAKILDQVESVLIYALQPELNIAKRCRKPKVDKPIEIHIQNFTQSKLLDGRMLWLKNGEPLSFC